MLDLAIISYILSGAFLIAAIVMFILLNIRSKTSSLSGALEQGQTEETHVENFSDARHRDKIYIFIAVVILTVIFAVVGTLGTVINNKQKMNDYIKLINNGTIASLENAINLNETKNDAYLRLAAVLSDQTEQIINSQDVSNKPGVVTTNDILKYFSQDRLSVIKKSNINDYVKINYYLGRLFWDYYQPKADSNETYIAAMPYFERAIAGANESADKRGGLTEQEYNLTKFDYIFCTLQVHQDQLKMGFDVQMSKTFINMFTPDEQKDLFNNKNVLVKPWSFYWDTDVKLLDLLVNETNIPKSVELNSISRLVFIFYNNTNEYKLNGVTASDMVSMFNQLNEISGNISVTDVKELTLKEKVKQELKIAKDQIESLYNIVLGDVN